MDILSSDNMLKEKIFGLKKRLDESSIYKDDALAEIKAIEEHLNLDKNFVEKNKELFDLFNTTKKYCEQNVILNIAIFDEPGYGDFQ